MANKRITLGERMISLETTVKLGFENLNEKVDAGNIINKEQDFKIQSICLKLKTRNGVEKEKKSITEGMKGYIMLGLVFLSAIMTVLAVITK